jgi:hypothetical protein
MPHFLAASVVHVFRVAIAIVAMTLVGAGAWLVAQLLSLPLRGYPAPTVAISLAVPLLAALIGGGYISAAWITPRSLVHAALAGLVLGAVYFLVFSHGYLSVRILIAVACGVVAAGGALIALRGRPLPNIR